MSTTPRSPIDRRGDPVNLKALYFHHRYGDGSTRWNWEIIAQSPSYPGRVVGYWHGCGFPTAEAAKEQGEHKLATLRGRPLWVIHITRSDLHYGVPRSCTSCAIAKALRRNSRRMDLEEIYLDSYGAWRSADGLQASCRDPFSRYGRVDKAIPSNRLPYVVTNRKTRNGIPSWSRDPMPEWTIDFDEWREVADGEITLTEYQHRHGLEPGSRPARLMPAFFVLDEGEFQLPRSAKEEFKTAA